MDDITKYENQVQVNTVAISKNPKEKVEVETLQTLYRQFIRKYPKSRQVPLYLYNSALLETQYLHHYKRAIRHFKELRNKYPDNPKCEEAYFMIGFIYSEKLHDVKRARSVFQNFIARYPKSSLIPSVKFELKYLGKSNQHLPIDSQ